MASEIVPLTEQEKEMYTVGKELRTSCEAELVDLKLKQSKLKKEADVIADVLKRGLQTGFIGQFFEMGSQNRTNWENVAKTLKAKYDIDHEEYKKIVASEKKPVPMMVQKTSK